MSERWKQRFENFEKAYSVLADALDANFSDLSDLEKMGCIQAFEITFELSWKVMKDYLVYSGINLIEISPRKVIQEAMAAGLIQDGDMWMSMLKNRNLTSHTYDESHILSGVEMIERDYLPHITALYNYLKGRHDG
ncbi:MAG TPA: nucleotidyltransferase substrate binding protein [Alphaproteobacteria bacterium]|nr:nucleotidyltransferase substrate binding protein [Alphaproteobacteria bacterium]USO04732.1 MAG: nucleotidyltransferase substrate binding protein [Rhodospirillales bacterium]HOO81243.1 nucleotidyltransferase substrate binding protein [Alphaproteobacteria bacterium]